MEIVDGRPYISQVKSLIIEYTNSLERDLSFQNLEEELEDPEKKYTSPNGELLVAIDGDTVIGMVAYHRHSNERCEMKRLYTNLEYRGQRLGEKLVNEIIRHAQNAGYKEMVLDTLEPMKPAIHLYQKIGFEECEPYYYNPYSDVIYMRKILQ